MFICFTARVIIYCSPLFVLLRWHHRAEVWLVHTAAFWLHCSSPPATLEHWLGDGRHGDAPAQQLPARFADGQLADADPTPGQPHHGLLRDVCQSHHHTGTLTARCQSASAQVAGVPGGQRSFWGLPATPKPPRAQIACKSSKTQPPPTPPSTIMLCCWTCHHHSNFQIWTWRRSSGVHYIFFPLVFICVCLL